MLLDWIEPDPVLVLLVPILEAIQPFHYCRGLFHFRKGLTLAVIRPPFFAKQALKTGEFFRCVVQDGLIDRDCRTLIWGHLAAHLITVALVREAVFPLDQPDHILLRPHHLLGQCVAEIGHHLGLRQFPMVPLLGVHPFRHPLGKKPLDIGEAARVPAAGNWMAFDLVEHLPDLV